MTTIIEGRLAFDFPAGWKASKYDNWTFYLSHFRKVGRSVKAVDIVAMQPDRTLWLIEIKDYAAEPRQKKIELAEEVALKVKDTLAGLMAARLRANVAAEGAFAQAAAGRRDLKVVLHLEQPRSPSRLHPLEDVSRLLQKLRQLLRAVDPHPRVTNLSQGNRFGWDVREV